MFDSFVFLPLSTRAYFKGRAYIKIILKNHARSYFAGRSYYRGNTVPTVFLVKQGKGCTIQSLSAVQRGQRQRKSPHNKERKRKNSGKKSCVSSSFMSLISRWCRIGFTNGTDEIMHKIKLIRRSYNYWLVSTPFHITDEISNYLQNTGKRML